MKDFFEDLIEYNFICNQKLLDVFGENEEKISEKAKLLLSHLINAQNIWNHRILEPTPISGTWEIIPLDELKKLNSINKEKTLEIISSKDLNTVLDYKTSNGDPFQDKILDIVFHSLNHATYHRGQIATELKNSGLKPVNTDYLYYHRLP